VTNLKTGDQLQPESKETTANQPADVVTKPATSAQKKLRTAKTETDTDSQNYEQISIFADKPPRTRSGARTQTLDEKKTRKVKELAVFTFAKQMSKYIFQCTKKAPKIYRWSIVAKMQTASIEFVEKLYNANAKVGDDRLALQFEADTKLKLLAFTAELAKDMTVISAHQFKTLSKHMLDCKKTLWGWIKCKK